MNVWIFNGLNFVYVCNSTKGKTFKFVAVFVYMYIRTKYLMPKILMP